MAPVVMTRYFIAGKGVRLVERLHPLAGHQLDGLDQVQVPPGPETEQGAGRLSQELIGRTHGQSSFALCGCTNTRLHKHNLHLLLLGGHLLVELDQPEHVLPRFTRRLRKDKFALHLSMHLLQGMNNWPRSPGQPTGSPSVRSISMISRRSCRVMGPERGIERPSTSATAWTRMKEEVRKTSSAV